MFVAYQHLNENLAKLTAKFEKATADKLKCQQEAESTAHTISLANRLVRRATAETQLATTTDKYTVFPVTAFLHSYRCVHTAILHFKSDVDFVLSLISSI